MCGIVYEERTEPKLPQSIRLLSRVFLIVYLGKGLYGYSLNGGSYMGVSSYNSKPLLPMTGNGKSL